MTGRTLHLVSVAAYPQGPVEGGRVHKDNVDGILRQHLNRCQSWMPPNTEPASAMQAVLDEEFPWDRIQTARTFGPINEGDPVLLVRKEAGEWNFYYFESY